MYIICNNILYYINLYLTSKLNLMEYNYYLATFRTTVGDKSHRRVKGRNRMKDR